VTELFGLTVDGDIDQADVAVAVVVVVELISAETSKPYLRLMSSDVPLWHRLGMLTTAVAADQADVVDAFEPDD